MQGLKENFMKKILIVVFMFAILFTGACKKSEDTSTEAYTMARFSQLTISTNKRGMNDYYYRLSFFLRASESGHGIDLYEFNITMKANGNVAKRVTWGPARIRNTWIEPGGVGLYAMTIDNYGPLPCDNCEINIKYRSGGQDRELNNQASVEVWVADPIVQYFNASTTTCNHGDSVTLSWKVSNAGSISIREYNDQDRYETPFTDLPEEGSVVVTPRYRSSFYELALTGGGSIVNEGIYISVLNIPPNVVYRVTGNGSRKAENIYYSTPEGGSTSLWGVRLPWTHTFQAEYNDWLYLSIRNSNSSGCITAEILVDGVLFDDATACGAYEDATAKGHNK